MKIFNKYKFSDKSQTLGGTLSTLMGVGSLVCLLYGIYVSFAAEGSGGIIVGTFGILAFILSFTGMILGLISFREQDKFYMLSKVGSLLCGITFITMVAIFLMGIGI